MDHAVPAKSHICGGVMKRIRQRIQREYIAQRTIREMEALGYSLADVDLELARRANARKAALRRMGRRQRCA